MKPGIGFFAVRGAVVLALVLALQGCAGHKAYQEGQALVGTGALEAGLAKMEEAIRLEPRNAEFRIGLATWRAMAINRL